MTTFNVQGPYEVPTTQMKLTRNVTSVDAAAFWEKHAAIAKECGCYVFAFKASKGYKPMYVGKATKKFKQEVFTPHKREKFNTALGDRGKGTPVLFFVCLGRTRGAVNKSAIDELESYLIQAGLAANQDLMNDKKTRVPGWSINGVLRNGKGKASTAAAELKRCIKV